VGSFFKGLALGLLGLLLWIVASVITGVSQAGEDLGGQETPVLFYVFVGIGFAVMIGGPLLYWFVFPIVGYLRRRRPTPGQEGR